jgi:hypothetical protein
MGIAIAFFTVCFTLSYIYLHCGVRDLPSAKCYLFPPTSRPPLSNVPRAASFLFWGQIMGGLLLHFCGQIWVVKCFMQDQMAQIKAEQNVSP